MFLLNVAQTALPVGATMGLVGLVAMAIIWALTSFSFGSFVMLATIAHSLKKTLNAIVDDKLDGYEKKALMPKWCEEDDMDDYFVDDLEMGGPGLATQKTEGATIQVGAISEGAITRYYAGTFALQLQISEEALEDKKYPKVLQAALRLKRALWKTIDIDATNMLVRATNTSYNGGDGVPLASASHTLPGGGTWSNQMTTAMSPSRMAMIIAITQIGLYPGHDGLTEGVEPKQVLCPLNQWGVWGGVLRSAKAPDPGIYNEINVVNADYDIGVQPIKYWQNTTTNWALQTDCDNGIKFLWRRRPRSNTWLNPNQQIMHYSIDARWARGWSDPRCVLFVNA